MNSLFQQYDIQLFALSKDGQKDLQTHAKRDQIGSITLLSDPSTEVIRAFGLEHHKAIEFITWNVLGIPLGVPIGFKTMAIPTTLLIDEKGIVRWIDQADDYRQRGNEARIKKAVHEVFAEKKEKN